MRLASVLLIGAAIAGVTGLALAAGPAVHEMIVATPDGGTAHIRYTGDTPPQVRFVQSPVVMTAFGPGFGAESPFAEIERIQAQMDRQMAAMMLQARQMHAAVLAGGPLYNAALSSSNQPSGSFCLRSVQITASPNGGAPKVVTHTEGNCGATPSPQPKTPAATTSSSSMGPLQTISYHPPRITPPPPRKI